MAALNTNVMPNNIDTTRHFDGAFGHFETELTARLIVKVCQNLRNRWMPVTILQLNETRLALGCGGFEDMVQGLIGLLDRRIVSCQGELIIVTTEFVEACYRHSPAL